MNNIKMKKYLLPGLALLLVGMLTGTVLAGDKPSGEEDLNKYVGTWDITAVIRVSEDAEPIEITGVAEKELVGGRWIVSRFEADYFGVPFKGQDVYGYDENTDQWTAVWVDSFSDYAVRHAGAISADGELIMLGQNKDAVSGEWISEKRLDEWKNVDEFDTNFVTVRPDGSEFQSLSIQHTRAQSAAGM